MAVDVGIGRVLREHTAAVHSVDFTNDGEAMLSAAADDRVCLYDCQKGVLTRATQCCTHGVGIARFSHDPLTVIVAGRDKGSANGESGVNCASAAATLRYLSLHDNRYLRAFNGHAAAVVGVELSPKEDVFASMAADACVRVWDLRAEQCQGVLRADAASSRGALAFDPHGLVMAAGLCGGLVKLFDVRAFSKGPFATFNVSADNQQLDFANVKFSYDGKFMLLGTAQGVVVCLDAFSGDVVNRYSGHSNERGLPLTACFSPDAQHVLCGSEDGTLWRWDTMSAEALPPLTGHLGSVSTVQCNPTRMLVASACSVVCLWLRSDGQSEPA